jgi:hypothetical protein
MKEIDNADRQETGRWKTTGPRIQASHFEGENGLCFALARCELYRNLSLSTAQFATISTRKEIFSRANLTVPMLLPSGVVSVQPNRSRVLEN